MQLLQNLKILLQCKYIYIILVFIVLVYSVYDTTFANHESKYNINTTSINGYIHNIDIDGDKLDLEIVAKEKLLCVYYFKTEMEKTQFIKLYKLGDYIRIEGKLTTPKGRTVFNLFNYKRYLLEEHIHYVLNADTIKKYKNNNKLKYKLKQLIISRIESIHRSKRYLYAFILGDDFYISDNVKSSYQINGISHLFAISGENIALLVLIIMMLLKKFKYKYFITFIFLYYYMFLTNFCPSIVRAGIFFILLSLNKMLKLNIKTVDILLLTLCVSLLFNPFLLYDVGFQFSFIISMYLIIFQGVITKYNNKIWNLFSVSFVAFLSSLPTVLNNFFQINLLSIVLNLIFVPFVSTVLFPLSLLCFIFSFLDTLFSILIDMLEQVSMLFSHINIFILILGKPTPILIVLYYIIITYVLYGVKNSQYKRLLLLLVLLIVNYNINIFNKYPEITFIDVGQGDSALIRLPNNKGNILIDTGGVMPYEKKKWQERNNTFSLGDDVVVAYIKSLGIKSINYLILTHGDYDHIGESIDVVNNIKVNNVVMNKDNICNNERNLIYVLKNKKINYFFVKEGDSIKIKDYKFYILNPHKVSDENSDSIVIYTVLNSKTVLFTGDANTGVEDYLMSKYKLSIDILKVGHHGSKTSSSDNFIKSIKPKYAIISVGLNNKFGHPSESVIKTLDKYNTKKYLTSIDGSVKFIFKKNNVTILTAGT